MKLSLVSPTRPINRVVRRERFHGLLVTPAGLEEESGSAEFRIGSAGAAPRIHLNRWPHGPDAALSRP